MDTPDSATGNLNAYSVVYRVPSATGATDSAFGNPDDPVIILEGTTDRCRLDFDETPAAAESTRAQVDRLRRRHFRQAEAARPRPDGDHPGAGGRGLRRSAQEARHSRRPEGRAPQERIAFEDAGAKQGGIRPGKEAETLTIARAGGKPRSSSSADLLQPLLVSRPIGDVEFRGASHLGGLHGIERADHPGRRSDDQGVLGKLFSFGDDRPRADDAAAADPGAVHDDRTHPDQRVLLERTAVQDDVMADRAILPDRQRKTHIGVAGPIVRHIIAFARSHPLALAAPAL